jgi:hypothetical protein
MALLAVTNAGGISRSHTLEIVAMKNPSSLSPFWALAGVASAQSSVTIYGRVDESFAKPTPRTSRSLTTAPPVVAVWASRARKIWATVCRLCSASSTVSTRTTVPSRQR